MKRLISIVTTVAVVLAFFFASTLLASATSPAFAKGEKSSQDLRQQGEEDGTVAGEADGTIAGAEDYMSGHKKNYLNTLPNDRDIIDKYKLLLDESTYRNYFISSYKKAYQGAYDKSYRDAKMDDVVKSDGTELGKMLGQASGAIEAMRDYSAERKNDYESAYKRYLKEGSLAGRFHFEKESSDYTNKFADGFQLGFKESYTESYRKRFAGFEMDNTSTYEVTMFTQEIVKIWPLYDVVNGVVNEREGISCKILVPDAAIYGTAQVQLMGEQFSFGSKNYRYTPVSPVFNIKMWNSAGAVKLRKPLELSFQFVGSDKVGIYKWRNYRWEYQPTEVSDGYIQTEIPAGIYNGGRYAIFIDESATPYRDANYNWARTEIYTFMRRHYLSDATYFRPDDVITRSEMAVLLYRVLGNLFPRGTVHYEAVDRDQYGYAADAIDFCISNGFMSLYQGTFNPDAPVRYGHVKYIYNAVRQDNITWDTVGKDIMTNRFYKSPGIDNLNLGLTRAEAVYFLYHYIDK